MSKPSDTGMHGIGPDKPKAAEQAPKSGSNGLLVNIVTTILICSLFLGVNYLMVNDASKKHMEISEQTEENDSETEEISKGYIMDLGEFTMNLADTSPKTYLRAALVIEISVNENESADGAPAADAHGHGGGGSSLEDELVRYKPAIRDVVITTLSSKTSDELSTTTGKELAKEQIAEQVNAIFAGEREVLRISFGQFIMQPGR